MAAGITGEALFATDDHDLRGTGLTWMAIRGDDPLKIQQRAGHRTFEMTRKYVRTAEAVGEVIGDVFPPLPRSLVAGRYRPANRPSDLQLLERLWTRLLAIRTVGEVEVVLSVAPFTMSEVRLNRIRR